MPSCCTAVHFPGAEGSFAYSSPFSPLKIFWKIWSRDDDEQRTRRHDRPQTAAFELFCFQWKRRCKLDIVAEKCFDDSTVAMRFLFYFLAVQFDGWLNAFHWCSGASLFLIICCFVCWLISFVCTRIDSSWWVLSRVFWLGSDWIERSAANQPRITRSAGWGECDEWATLTRNNSFLIGRI